MPAALRGRVADRLGVEPAPRLARIVVAAVKRLLKFLHELGSTGMMGALAVELILVVRSHGLLPVAYASERQAILAVAQWLLLPSLTLVLFTGLMAMAATPAYQNAGWAWIKTLLGVSVLEGTLGGVIGPAKDAAKLSALALTGEGDAVGLTDALRHEWGGLWLLLVLSVVNVALSVWRPKLSRAGSDGDTPE